MLLEDIGKHSSYNTSFYRYEGLDHVLQCADYIKANGKNIGCMFPYLESSDYKDFYICVNGSSESQVIRPSYYIFQLQNIGEVNKQLQNVSSLGHLQSTMWKRRDRDRDKGDTYRNAKPENWGPTEYEEALIKYESMEDKELNEYKVSFSFRTHNLFPSLSLSAIKYFCPVLVME